MVSTKIDANHDRIQRVRDLDEWARVLFPGNRNHQQLFLAVFIELKWAPGQFLAVLEPVADRYGLSRRVLETVRAKMRRLGLIDHVSRFNKRHGYREGWVFSNKFAPALRCLGDQSTAFRQADDPRQEQKDRDVFRYL